MTRLRQFLAVALVGLALSGCAVLPHGSCPLKSEAVAPAFDQATLLPGDVLLYAPTSLVGDLIAVKTGRLKSHVEVYAGSGKVVAAREEGVNVYDVRIDASLACVRRARDHERFDGGLALQAVGPLLGQPYDFTGLFSFFDPWRASKHVVRVCSTVDAIYLRGGGCEPFNPDLVSNGVTPASFFETGGLVTVWRNPAIDRGLPAKNANGAKGSR